MTSDSRRRTRPGPARGAAPVAIAMLSLLAAPPTALDLAAQQPIALGEPTAVAAEPRGAVSGLRELPGGGLLVADGVEGRLYRLSPDLAAVETVGREGQGPKEYRQPDRLFALPGDSTLMLDLGNGRLALLAPDGSIARTEPIARDDGDGGLVLVLPRATDARGGIWFEVREGPGGRPVDSIEVRRLDPATGAAETVARLAPPPVKRSTGGGPGAMQERIMPVPFGAADGWAVGPAGLVVVRADPYRVERVTPDGSRATGPVVDWTPVPVRRADRTEWLDALGGGLMVMVTEENGVARANFRRGGGRPPGLDEDAFEWPDGKPAFFPDGVSVDPAGRAWVRRHVAAGRPSVFDLFGPDGRRTGQVVLPAGRSLAGFGRDAVYLVRTDELEFAWLERYAALDAGAVSRGDGPR
jgi:hypothetical protein